MSQRKTILLVTLLMITVGALWPPFSHGDDERTASELAGLWYAHRDFGPEISGIMELRREGGEWHAEIAGDYAQAPVEPAGIDITFAGDKGELRARLNPDDSTVIGHWIQPTTVSNYVRYASPVTLAKVGPDHWEGNIVPLPDEMTFYLSLHQRDDGTIGGVLLNPENNFGRFFRIGNVVIRDDLVSIVEPGRTNARLQGPYYPDYDQFSIFIPDAGGTFDFHRVANADASHFFPRSRTAGAYEYAVTTPHQDGWETASLTDVGMAVAPMDELVDFVTGTQMDSASAPYIHAILVARHGKLVFEEYFHGYTADMTHDTRSASKTVTTTLIGMAMQAGEPISPSSPVYEIMYSGTPPAGLDPWKREIQLKHLMTMTPGFDCDDADANSPGNEELMQSQTEQPDWWQYTLDLPMVNEPGSVATYCSGSPNLALGVLQHATRTWIPVLLQNYFADPLQVATYHMNLMPSGDAYGGGGLYIRPRDFLKLAQLYLNDGVWNGQRLLSKDWVREAMTPYTTMFDQGYGYGWWITEFPYGDRTVKAYYAGGNGGQYAVAIPELDLAISMFGGNYGQATTHMAKKVHIPNYILRSVFLGDSTESANPLQPPGK